MKFLIESYGCAQNIAFGRGLEEVLEGKGLVAANSLDEADFVVVNTCTVKAVTEARMLHRIRWLLDQKKRTLVTGCMATAQPGTLLKLVNRNEIIPLESFKSWSPESSSGEKRRRPVKWFEELPQIPSRPVHGRAILPISRGCLGNCSYCIVRNAVGPLRSYGKSEIVSKARQLIKKGALEFYLTAQDLAVYGKDNKGDLLDLLTSLSKLDGDFRIRLGMMTPNQATPIIHDLLVLLARNEKFYQFLHLPVQSGDDRILRIMGRNYTASDFKKLVILGRKTMKDLNVATDLIIGFPFETEEAFRNSMGLIRDTRPNKVNLSKFAPRPHTVASLLPTLPSSTIDRRAKVAHLACREISQEVNSSFVGSSVQIFILKRTSEGYSGRTTNYLPAKVMATTELRPGEVISAKVISATASGLTTSPD